MSPARAAGPSTDVGCGGIDPIPVTKIHLKTPVKTPA